MEAKLFGLFQNLGSPAMSLESLIQSRWAMGFLSYALNSAETYQVLYFFVVNGKAVLTHGFIKKTQKTPKAEFERAKRYRDDYLRRKD